MSAMYFLMMHKGGELAEAPPSWAVLAMLAVVAGLSSAYSAHLQRRQSKR